MSGVGRDQLAPVGEALDENRNQRPGGSDHHADGGDHCPADHLSYRASPDDPGLRQPCRDEDEERNGDLEGRLGQEARKLSADDRSDDRAERNPQRETPLDVGALHCGTSGIGTQLDGSVQRNDGRRGEHQR